MLCHTSHLHTSRLKAEELILYINGHFQFENMFSKIAKSHKTRKIVTLTEKLSKLYAQIFVLTGITFPTAVLALHWIKPCTASLPGYWLLSECMDQRSNSQTESNFKFGTGLMQIFVKVFVFAFSQWTWQFGVNASVFIIGGLTTLGTCSIRNHLAK